MPELPEVHTTVEGIKRVAVGKTITDIWSDFHIKTAHGERQTLKNKKYYENFRKIVKGKKIIGAERRGKNILINLNNLYTIVIHMKMTGHVMYGKYKFKNSSVNEPCEPRRSEHEEFSSKKISVRESRRNFGTWAAIEKWPLQDPYNQYIHFVISLSDGKHLVLSDMRKFASVTISKTSELHLHDSIEALGIDPLDKKLNPRLLREIIYKRKNMPIKSALLDQTGLAGIGNIYSDEVLWETGIHPLSPAFRIP